MQEAGRDWLWVHRLLEAHGVQSHVVERWLGLSAQARGLDKGTSNYRVVCAKGSTRNKRI